MNDHIFQFLNYINVRDKFTTIEEDLQLMLKNNLVFHIYI